MKITDETGRKKLWTLFFSIIAVAAIILLAASLSELEFLPAHPFSFGSDVRTGTVDLGLLPGVEILMILVRVSFALAWLLLPVAIVYLIISPKFRKRVFRGFLSLLSFVLMAYALMRVLPNLSEREGDALGPGVQLPSMAFSSEPFAEFIAEPPRWLVLAASVGLALLLAGLLVGGAWFVWRRFRRPVSPLKQLALGAQDAIESLQAGGDLKNVVMRCYLKMARVLNEQRGIQRQRHMTPREFEGRLEDAGLPGEPVRQLTRLFEDVRYGTKVPGEQEERQAIACLTAIIEACRSSP